MTEAEELDYQDTPPVEDGISSNRAVLRGTQEYRAGSRHMAPLAEPGDGEVVNRALAEAIDADLDATEAEWVQKFERGGNKVFSSIGLMRSSMDHPSWRSIEAQKRLARDAALRPARRFDAAIGANPKREFRQVNVKLGEPDFEGLKALALERDVPPSTMARILLRRAILDAAGLGPG